MYPVEIKNFSGVKHPVYNRQHVRYRRCLFPTQEQHFCNNVCDQIHPILQKESTNKIFLLNLKVIPNNQTTTNLKICPNQHRSGNSYQSKMVLQQGFQAADRKEVLRRKYVCSIWKIISFIEAKVQQKKSKGEV